MFRKLALLPRQVRPLIAIKLQDTVLFSFSGVTLLLELIYGPPSSNGQCLNFKS